MKSANYSMKKNDIEKKIYEDFDVMDSYERRFSLKSEPEWCDKMDDIQKEALPVRDHWANKVAKLYFVISKK